MCLAVPGMILEVEQQANSRVGTIQFGGITRPAYLDFVPEANVGDYVIVHVGFAISRIDAEEARRTYDILEKMGLLKEEGLQPDGEGSQ
jgi:hydrogenase expression/formation protein HypC